MIRIEGAEVATAEDVIRKCCKIGLSELGGLFSLHLSRQDFILKGSFVSPVEIAAKLVNSSKVIGESMMGSMRILKDKNGVICSVWYDKSDKTLWMFQYIAGIKDMYASELDTCYEAALMWESEIKVACDREFSRHYYNLRLPNGQTISSPWYESLDHSRLEKEKEGLMKKVEYLKLMESMDRSQAIIPCVAL